MVSVLKYNTHKYGDQPYKMLPPSHCHSFFLLAINSLCTKKKRSLSLYRIEYTLLMCIQCRKSEIYSQAINDWHYLSFIRTIRCPYFDFPIKYYACRNVCILDGLHWTVRFSEREHFKELFFHHSIELPITCSIIAL